MRRVSFLLSSARMRHILTHGRAMFKSNRATSLSGFKGNDCHLKSSVIDEEKLRNQPYEIRSRPINNPPNPPPQNLEAEQCVLGSIMLQQEAMPKAAEFLNQEDFYRDAHKSIFAAMTTLFDRSEPIDLITVSNLLKDNNRFDAVGGPTYLATLTDIVPVAANISYYAKIVREKAILRRLIQNGTEIAGRCYEEQDDIDTLLDDVETTVFEISRAKSGQSYHSLKTVISSTFKYIEELYERKEHITGVPTEYHDFDKMKRACNARTLSSLPGAPVWAKQPWLSIWCRTLRCSTRFQWRSSVLRCPKNSSVCGCSVQSAGLTPNALEPAF